VARLLAKLVGLAIILVLMSDAGWCQKSASPAPSEKLPTKVISKKPLATAEDQRREIIFNLLEEAHAAAEELPTERQIAILKVICGTGFDSLHGWQPGGMAGNSKVRHGQFATVSNPELSNRLKQWSEELYSAADGLESGSYARLDAQAVAVRAMVPADDKRALEMLDGLDASDVKGAQEQRNYLAVWVFSEMMQRGGDSVVQDLRARAQTLGESGQYPYVAMAAVTSRVRNKELIRSIFNDALSSYQRSTDKLNSMFGMLSLLGDEQMRHNLEPWQVHEASVQIADRLKAEIEREQRAFEEGKPTRPGMTLIADRLCARLKEINPDLAATIPKMPPHTVIPARQTIGDDVPVTVLSPALKKLKSDFEKTSTRLMEMSEDEVHGGAELRQVIDRGVELGTELLHASTQDAEDHMSALNKAMPPVTDFVQVGARTNPAMTLAAVRKVQDSELRARMLLTIAVGLPDPKGEY
jgi:hypothetical protein